MPWKTENTSTDDCRYCHGSGQEILFCQFSPCRNGCTIPAVPISAGAFWRRVRAAAQKDPGGLTYVYKSAAAEAFGLTEDELAGRVAHLVGGKVLDITQHSYRERP